MQPIKRLLSSQFPAIKSLQTSSVHHGIAGSKHYFVSLPPGRDKLDMLVEVLGADARRGQKVLVFCNGIDSCRAVEHTCRERGLKTTCYHGDMPVLMRAESMKLFAGV
jgi:superfamily II DNA/RNA helicase